MWKEFENRLLNLEQCREIRLIKKQFGGYCIRIDGTDYDIPNAEMVYQKIKQELIKAR